MKYRLLSYPIENKTPLYGSTPAPVIAPYRQISKGDTSNSYTITIHNHTGTHVDAPKHFVPDGRSISEYSLEELTFYNPAILECTKNPGEWIELEEIQQAAQKLYRVDCLLLHTGFGRFRDQEIYRTHNPGIAPEVIFWIRKEFPDIRCIGIDSISISSFQHKERGREAHTAAFIKQKDLGEPLFVIEDMNLNTLSGDDKLKKVIVIPWQILGIDSAPCTVLVEVISNDGKI